MVTELKDSITITLDEYNELLRESQILNALFANGVDNWEWYGDAIESLNSQ